MSDLNVIVDTNTINVTVQQCPSIFITTSNPVIQTAFTDTGSLTGLFYPLNSNPSGYFSAYNQSGAYIFRTTINSGVNQQYITFPAELDQNARVISALNTEFGSSIFVQETSGISSVGFWAIFSDNIDNSGYYLDTMACLSNSLGLATTVIINSGDFIDSGSFVQSSPSGASWRFISGQLQTWDWGYSGWVFTYSSGGILYTSAPITGY